jgi:DNA-binding response OmpR family regulator
MTTVLVYSSDALVRDEVRMSIGRSPAAGVDDVTFLMTENADQVIRAVTEGLADILVLDGEAWPTGGLGLCRELKNSDIACPPVVVLIGRRDDRWLGVWSQADAVLARPIDAYELSRAVVALLTGGVLPTPTVRA